MFASTGTALGGLTIGAILREGTQDGHSEEMPRGAERRFTRDETRSSSSSRSGAISSQYSLGTESAKPAQCFVAGAAFLRAFTAAICRRCAKLLYLRG